MNCRRRCRLPATVGGPLAWIRQNLFPNWWNGLLTLVLAYLLLPLIWSALDWALFSATWQEQPRGLRPGRCLLDLHREPAGAVSLWLLPG